MRQKTSKWYEVKVAYDKTLEDGRCKKVTELFVVEAMSFTEAEAKVAKDIVGEYITGDYDVKAITIPQYSEVWFTDDNSHDYKWYKAKLQFVTIDENSQKEKKTNVYYLVQANSFDAAKKHVEDVMGTTMVDYVIASIKETNILDLFEISNKE